MELTAKKTDTKKEKAQSAKNRKKPKHLVRKVLIILVVLALLVGSAWYLIRSLQAEYTVTYQAYTASVGTISNALSFNGTLQAINSAIYTANSPGTVRTVYKQAGDQVHKGDKILKLSTGQLVEAEFDGEVNVMEVKEGDSVAAGADLCQIVDFVHMKTSIRVDEYDINDVHVGDVIRVTTTANEKTFESKIAAINHTSSSSGSVAYYTATAYVNVDGEVFPGMQLTVTLPQEEASNVVILKMNAISFDEENSAFVYTKDDNGEMQKTYITTGVSNGSYTEIKSGLSDGDIVYAEVEVETQSAAGSFLSDLFGQTQVMGNPQDFSRDMKGAPDGNFNFNPGSGERPSFGGGGGFGGGNR